MIKMAELPKDKAFGTLGLFYWSDTFSKVAPILGSFYLAETERGNSRAL